MVLFFFKRKGSKKNAKNLFGSSKLKFDPCKAEIFSYRDGNIDAFKWKDKIVVQGLGGWFRDYFEEEYKVKVKKISGKSTKTVVMECGIMRYKSPEFKKKEYVKWGTYTLTLKPANNKYGCIITNIKENWMQPDNWTFQAG